MQSVMGTTHRMSKRAFAMLPSAEKIGHLSTTRQGLVNRLVVPDRKRIFIISRLIIILAM